MNKYKTKSDLLALLQVALELELSTIPPYLVALLSMKLPRNREAADRIRTVLIEEMLHLALVANVMNALGGEPRLRGDAVPSYPLTMTFEGKPFRDRSFPISLAPFSPECISTFLEIEKPDWALRPNLLEAKIAVPAPTIGLFYKQIQELLDALGKSSPASLFDGDPARQLEQDFYWSSGSEIVRVTDLVSAKAALELVIEQGEGAWAASPAFQARTPGEIFPLGHYFRFNEIRHGRRYDLADDPEGAPTGAPLLVDYAAVYPLKPDADAADYPQGSEAQVLNDRFNADYSLMLRQIEEALNGSPRLLYTAIMNGMHQLSTLARTLMQTPIPGDASGRTACPTFDWVDP